jgi:tRNA nucleotidyltransferase (CCA-adding enzyme)
VYEAFGTATVGDVDLATARSERYAEPGALPEVRAASLADDLARRDFSINAIAAALADGAFGEVTDPHGGVADVRAGVVRVLHDASFRDDSTRLLRAARYTARLGFRLDEATAAQAREVAGARLVTTVGGPRLRDALLLLLGEDGAPAALALLTDLGVLAAIAPGLAVEAAALADLDSLAAEMPDVDRGRARLALLLRSLAPDERSRLAAWLRLRRNDARVVLAAAAATPDDLAQLPPEAALVVGGDAGRRWLAEHRHVTLEVDGNDLVAELGLTPGPDVGRILEALLHAKRAGELPDRAAELQRARALLA